MSNRTILVLGAILLAAWLWQYLRRWRALRAAAQRIVEMLRTGFAAEHELRVVHDVPDDVRPHLDAAVEQLKDTGLRTAFDFEDVTVSQAAGRTIPVRVLAAPDQPLTASVYYHPQAERLFIDVSTALSDGRQLTTTTAADALKLQNPPELERVAVPADDPLADVVARHRRWLDEQLAASAGALTASAPRTADEFLDATRRIQRLKHDFRKGLGWITLDELTRLSNGRQDVARVTHQHIQRILAREKRQDT